MQQKNIYYCIFLSAILLITMMFSSVLYGQKEGFIDLSASNDLLGGAILTLQEELDTLNENLDTILSDLQDIYDKTPEVLTNTITPAGKIYNNILEFTAYSNAIINNPIVHTPPPVNPDPAKKSSDGTVSGTSDSYYSSNISSDSSIVNTSIKTYPSWNLFRTILENSKTPLKNVLDSINEYLAMNKIPNEDMEDIIDSMKTQILPINTIQIYINQILTVPEYKK